jgi:hypothetical protein
MKTNHKITTIVLLIAAMAVTSRCGNSQHRGISGSETNPTTVDHDPTGNDPDIGSCRYPPCGADIWTPPHTLGGGLSIPGGAH